MTFCAVINKPASSCSNDNNDHCQLNFVSKYICVQDLMRFCLENRPQRLFAELCDETFGQWHITSEVGFVFGVNEPIDISQSHRFPAINLSFFHGERGWISSPITCGLGASDVQIKHAFIFVQLIRFWKNKIVMSRHFKRQKGQDNAFKIF